MRIKEKYTQMSKEGNEIKKKKTGWGHREEKGGEAFTRWRRTWTKAIIVN